LFSSVLETISSMLSFPSVNSGWIVQNFWATLCLVKV
jgi:hypothetical protein